MKIFFIAIIGVLVTNVSVAECISYTGKYYTACKPGYYLQSARIHPDGTVSMPPSCVACPEPGTSDDSNTSGITSCYLGPGVQYQDDTGTFEFTEKCYYDARPPRPDQGS